MAVQPKKPQARQQSWGGVHWELSVQLVSAILPEPSRESEARNCAVDAPAS